MVCRSAERGDAATVLGEAVDVEMGEGKPAERFGGDLAERQAIARLAEDLRRDRVVAGRRALGEAGKRERVASRALKLAAAAERKLQGPKLAAT
jgi:hypothetical protein